MSRPSSRAALAARAACKVHALEKHLAVFGEFHAGCQAQQSRLALPALADDGDGLLGAYVERKVLQDQSGTPALAIPHTNASQRQQIALLNENGEAETTGYHATQTNGALYSPGDVNAGKTEWHFGGPGIDPVPLVTTEGSSVNPPSSVEVKGAVDPNNLETHYYFEYGPTTSMAA
jgi:hypothetical protein